MIGLQRTKPKASERGFALVVALLTLLLISALLMGMIVASNSETNISANFRDEQVAFFAARAGLEEIRDRMRSGSTNSINASLPTALPGTNNGVLYITNPTGAEVVAPWNTAGTNYPDDEICKEVTCAGTAPAGAPWYTTASASASYAANPKLAWKWVRLMAKPNKSATGLARITSVDGLTNGNRVCWNGGNEVATALANCGANTPVYTLTALAVTPSGSRRMVQYEETLNVNIPIVAAMYAKDHIDTGQALNVTGATDSICTAPSVYGAASGTNTVTTPGSGNVTGSPAGTVNSYGWNNNMITNLVNSLSSSSTDLSTLPGVTHDSSSPPNYTLTHGTVGTAPTVTYSGSDNVTAITSPGAPVTYITPDLTITPVTNPPTYNTFTLGGASPGISGEGVLIVRGNLTMDFGQNFSYFGLILVEGNVNMINTGGGNANPKIHGAIIAGGTILANGTGMGNFNGSISIHQNACMVNSALGGQFYKTVTGRELVY
jgi:Tfp pilus assembly protein PilX